MDKLLLILLFFSSLQASAFTLNSTSNPNLKGWANHNVKFMVNTANCPANVDVPGLISESAAVWNNLATSDISATYGGSTSSTTFASPPTVYCEPNFQAVVGADPNFVPGAGAVDGTTGRIAAGVLILNASGGTGNIGLFDHEILKIILAHEIGHILGLGHSADRNALMYYDASEKQHLLLAQDDIDGMTYLYPADTVANPSLAGCGLIRNKNTMPPPRLLMVLILLLLLPVTTALVLRSDGLTRIINIFDF
ncbi:MAG: matrixin family metalloprotease [Pseudobdellovibrio sp.]